MTASSLLRFKAISRVHFLGTTASNVKVGDAFIVSIYQRNVNLQIFSMYYDYIDGHSPITYPYITNLCLMYSM